MSRRLQLLRLLEDYAPAGNEARVHAEMLTLAGESGDVLSRYHFDPGHFTVSGFVVSTDGSHLLLVLHRRLGKWLQPGGHIDPDDGDLYGAASREIAEETGLGGLTSIGDGFFDIDVHEIPAAGGEPRHQHHDLRFLFRAAGEPIAGDGVDDAGWMPLAEVPGLGVDRSVLRAVAKLTA